MRFLELNLMAFGPFTDLQIDLSGGNYGLHLIYGANEAGKSSTLRAITDFLFGIPIRSADNFLHAHADLRVGASLQHSDGRRLQAIRRKANQKSLRRPIDDQPLLEEVLQPFLGNVDRDLFCAMFGINHESLRSGGQEIAAGKGRLGELLFSASTGLVNLRATHRSIHEQIEELLKPTGRSGKIHDGLQQLSERKSALKESQVTVETWVYWKTALDCAWKRRDEVDQQLGDLRRDLERLTRFEKSLTAISLWRTQCERCQALRHVPLLDKDFDRQTAELNLRLATAQTRHQEIEKQLQLVELQLGSLNVSEELLELSDLMENFRDRFASYRKAQQDRPSVIAKRDMYEQEIKELLTELGYSGQLNKIELLRVPKDRRAKIYQLSVQQVELSERRKSTRAAVEKLRQQVQQLQKKLVFLPEIQDISRAKTVLQFALQHAELDNKLVENQQEQNRIQHQIDTSLARLPLWQGNLEQLEGGALPREATMDRWESELQAHAQALTNWDRMLEEQHRLQESVHRKLKELEVHAALPTEEELHLARVRRDELWASIRSQFDSEQPSRFHEQDPQLQEPRLKLATALSDSIVEADRIADRLRHDAERVAMKQQWLLEQELLEQKLAKLESDRAKAATLYFQAQANWENVWKPLRIQPLSPREMSEWMRQFQVLLQLRDQLTELQAERHQLEHQIEGVRSLVLNALSADSAAEKVDGLSLGLLIRHLNDFCDRQQAAIQNRNQLHSEIASRQQQLAELEQVGDSTDQEIQLMSKDWSNEMQFLGLESDALPAQAEARLEILAELMNYKKEWDTQCRRVNHIDRDANLFANEVAELAKKFVPEVCNQTPDEQFLALRRLFETHQEAAKTRNNLLEQKIELIRDVAAYRGLQEQAQAELDQMKQVAKVEALDQLIGAARKSQERMAAEENLRTAEEQVSSFSNGKPLAAFIAEVEAELAHPQPFNFRIQQLLERIEQLVQDRDQVMAQCTTAELELARFDGGADAAEKAFLVENCLAKLDEQLHQLTVLKLSAAVLAFGIEQHRAKNEGPVLERAGQIFRDITAGRYDGLRADFNDRGEPVVAGVRNGKSDGRSGLITVEAMSDGTRDQLYLALRLASLESWLKNHEPIPLIVDDILLNFDDARSLSTLKALAELSHQTQVIFFTHHRHLLELAENHLSPGELFTTRLEQGLIARAS